MENECRKLKFLRAHRKCRQILDKLLQDACDENDTHKQSGWNTIILWGDFRQTLPVVPHELRATLIVHCVKSEHKFVHYHEKFVEFSRKLVTTKSRDSLSAMKILFKYLSY